MYGGAIYSVTHHRMTCRILCFRTSFFLLRYFMLKIMVLTLKIIIFASSLFIKVIKTTFSLCTMSSEPYARFMRMQGRGVKVMNSN